MTIEFRLMVELQGDDPCVPPYKDGPQPVEDKLLRKDAGLSRLSSVRPLCHTDQAPPRPASRLKGVYYEKTISAFNRRHTRQGNAWERATCSPLKKEVVRRSPMEPSGAVSVGYH